METKKEWKFFSIWGYEKEQEYLRTMHKRGWKFPSLKRKSSGALTKHRREYRKERLRSEKNRC